VKKSNRRKKEMVNEAHPVKENNASFLGKIM
jgi:hypothetical protein